MRFNRNPSHGGTTTHGLIPGGGNRTKNGIPESLPIGLFGGANNLLHPGLEPRHRTPTPRTRNKEAAVRPRTASQDFPCGITGGATDSLHFLNTAVGADIKLRPLPYNCGLATERQ